jgi:hypothetical protein
MPKYLFVPGAVLLMAAAPAPPPIATITQDAAAQDTELCPSGTGYPSEFSYGLIGASVPVSATSGTPKIEQLRGGQVIATYTSFANQPGCTLAGDGTDYLNPAAPAASGCGPFTREHTWRLWQPGDVFLVYPAVYAGQYNQPWVGPQFDSGADYAAGISHAPDNITIQGVVVNNTRPVILLNEGASNNTLGQAPLYFDVSNGFTLDSVNVSAVNGASVGKAGVYESGGSNLTLSNMRINGFEYAGANGLFGAGNYSGTLTLTKLELDHNGGPNGPAHNAYIGASTIDPNFTVVMQRSWSHSAYYGHLFKTRAQNNVFIANYFRGGVPQGGPYQQAEAYLLDIPNGGRATLRDNIFIKNASGANSNGAAVTFLVEGATDNRPQSLDVENNSFFTFAKTYDGSGLNFPFFLLYPALRPDSPSWPAAIPTRFIKNAFTGFCQAGGGNAEDYRGDYYVVESFAETTGLLSFRTKIPASDAAFAALYPDYVAELGMPAFGFNYTLAPVRTLTTIGAEN